MLVGALALCGCSWRLWPDHDDSDFIEIPPLTEPNHAQDILDEARRPPDGAVLCEEDADCDDGVSCTVDQCLKDGYCRITTDNAACSDGVFCNGVEVCNPFEGCLPGARLTCDDGDVCTVDSCDEDAKQCVSEPRDFDGDGEVDWHCAGGTDCDDFDATRRSGGSEVCGDSIDNDCDSRTDESTCGRPVHDTCEDALMLDGSGTYAIGLRGAVRDYSLACDKSITRDVVFAFELAQAQAVDLSVRGVLPDGSEEVVSMALRSECRRLDADVECQVGFPAAHIRRGALEPGQYFLIVDSPNAREVVLSADFEPPHEAAPNVSCESAIDVGQGGRFRGSFVDVPDSFTTPCGPSGLADEGARRPQADLVYSFTLSEERDVLISAVSVTDEPLSISVRDQCGEGAIPLSCRHGSPAQARVHQLQVGTYYLVVESPSYREVDFELDVRMLDPTPAPPGDGCEDPLELVLGEPSLVSLANKQDEVATGCDLFAADLVYRLDVAEPTDLDIQVSATSMSVRYALQTACGDVKQELFCAQGRPGRRRARNLSPGEYFLVVESPNGQNLEVIVEALPLTQPMLAEGNDTCFDAIDIPETGGVYQGSTRLALQDYEACANSRSPDVTFRLELTEPRTVTALTEADFDTVLYRYEDDEGSGPGLCATSAPVVCTDDGLDTNATLENELLGPGTYYYVLDGFGTDSSGNYIFEVIVD